MGTFFGFSLTSYIRDTWKIDFPKSNKTGKFEGFAFISAPAHVADKCDNKLKVEDAALTRKGSNNNTSSKSQRPSVVVNIFLKIIIYTGKIFCL